MPEWPIGSREADAAERTAPDTLRVLWERKFLVILATIAAIGASLILSQASEKQYTADSELLLRDPGFAKTLFGADLFEGSVDPEREASTQIAVIQSPAVALRVARLIDSRLVIEDLRDAVEVTPNENSDVITISATTPTAARSAAIANAFASEYIAYQRELDRRKVQDAQRLVRGNLDTPSADGAEASGLQESLKQLKVLEALQTGNADIVAVARPPDDPSSPKPLRNALLAGLLGLLLGVGLALLADFLDRRLKSTEDFERAFGHSVLVSIPFGSVPEVADDELTGIKAEPYRILRESLRFLEIAGEHRTLLVTSADTGEGKTTVAVNLARALATGGERVVLIDADLRRPTASTQLNVEPQPVGLATGLLLRQPVEDLLVNVAGSLRLLPAGPIPPNPADLLRAEAMHDVVEQARAEADVVIIDAAPLLPVSDTRALLDLPNIDGVLMIGRSFYTKRDRALAARRVLTQSDRPVLGIVVTGTRDRADFSSYYGAYGDVNGGDGTGRRARRADAPLDTSVKPQ